MKKEIIIPFIILLLGLIFVIINLIVYFSGGNPWFVSKKLKTGAMILSLTAIVACGTPAPQEQTCYAKPNTNDSADSINKVKKEDSIKAEIIRQKKDSMPRTRTCYVKVADKKTK